MDLNSFTSIVFSSFSNASRIRIPSRKLSIQFFIYLHLLKKNSTNYYSNFHLCFYYVQSAPLGMWKFEERESDHDVIDVDDHDFDFRGFKGCKDQSYFCFFTVYLFNHLSSYFLTFFFNFFSFFFSFFINFFHFLSYFLAHFLSSRFWFI